MDMEDASFRILVVDDERPMREICSEVLVSKGYTVTTVAEACEALDMLDKGWDLIVSDVNMAGMDGRGLLRAAEERIPGISDRFLFMTGDVVSATEIEGMNLGVILKPFKVRDFLGAVGAALKDAGSGRRAKRVALDGCMLHVSIDGSVLAAVAEDLSLNGMKIKYPGRPIEAGPGIRIFIDGLNIRREARVVWSSASTGSESFSGVTFEMPVPASVISGLVSGSL